MKKLLPLVFAFGVLALLVTTNRAYGQISHAFNQAMMKANAAEPKKHETALDYKNHGFHLQPFILIRGGFLSKADFIERYCGKDAKDAYNNYLRLKSVPEIHLNVDDAKSDPNSAIAEKEYAIFDGTAGWDDHTVIHCKVRIDHIWKHDFDETMIIYFKLRKNSSTGTKSGYSHMKYRVSHIRIFERGNPMMSEVYTEICKFGLRFLLDELGVGFLSIATDAGLDAIKNKAVKAWRPAFAHMMVVLFKGMATGEIGNNDTRMLLSHYEVEPVYAKDHITSTQHRYFNYSSHWNVMTAGKVLRNRKSGSMPLNLYEHSETRETLTMVGDPNTNALPSSVSYWTFGGREWKIDLSKYRFKYNLGYVLPAKSGKATRQLILLYHPEKKDFLTVTDAYPLYTAKKFGYMTIGELKKNKFMPLPFLSPLVVGYIYPKSESGDLSTLSVWVKRSEFK